MQPCIIPHVFSATSIRNDRSRAQRISAASHFSSFTQLHTEIIPQPASACRFSRNYPRQFFRGEHSFLWIYLFALRLAVSYSLLCSVREVWFVSTCHLRQGNSSVRAPLRLRMTSIRIAFSVLSIVVDTTLRESRVVYRQRMDHVGCFCCRAIVKLFLLLLIKSLL